MAKFLLFFVFIIVILIIGLVALYFFYEKPAQKETNPELTNLTIYSFDAYNDSAISTNFMLYKDGVNFYNGTTVSGGGSLVNVPVNHSYTVRNYNQEDQDYYTTWKDVSLFGSKIPPTRIDLKLEQPANLSAIITEDPIAISDNLTLSTTDRAVKNISICIRWSVNLISVVAEGYNVNLTRIETYPKYHTYDKCWYIGTITKDNSPFIIDIYPTSYIDETSRDYIDVVIIDQDCFRDNCKIEENGMDLGMKDITLTSNLFVFQ